jgi:lipid A 4'-phosphatase
MKTRHHSWRFSLMGLFFFVGLFALWPTLDKQFSDLFYDPLLPGFKAKQHEWVLLIYQLAPKVNQLLLLASVLVVALSWIKPEVVNIKWRRRCLTWILMMVVGIGVVVDWALKDHVGRTRPEHSTAYGGSLISLPLFEFDHGCLENCSFVSGHAAGGFALMAWGMWAPRRTRHRWFAAGVVAGLGIGGVRIAQGGHYLSDVIFAGWVILFVHLLIHYFWLHWRLRRLHSRRH